MRNDTIGVLPSFEPISGPTLSDVLRVLRDAEKSLEQAAVIAGGVDDRLNGIRPPAAEGKSMVNVVTTGSIQELLEMARGLDAMASRLITTVAAIDRTTS